jgi:hypothetical protein
MSSWITPGMIDAIVAGVALEFAGLGALLLHARAPHLLGVLFLYLASGACLLLALRASLADAGMHWIALALLASLIAHAASLWHSQRVFFRAAPPAPSRPACRRSV